jgi:hypothetical protein
MLLIDKMLYREDSRSTVSQWNKVIVVASIADHGKPESVPGKVQACIASHASVLL